MQRFVGEDTNKGDNIYTFFRQKAINSSASSFEITYWNIHPTIAKAERKKNLKSTKTPKATVAKRANIKFI
jgi:hypothetical protein